MGEAVTVVSGLYQADAQRQAGKFSNRIAKFNADIADLQAEDAIYRGGLERGRVSDAVRKTIGSQRAAMAASGTVVDDGSNAALIDDSERAGRADMTTIKNNAMREAWGLKVQAAGYRIQGRFDAFTGRQQATGTLLTTGAKAYEQAQQRAALTAGA